MKLLALLILCLTGCATREIPDPDSALTDEAWFWKYHHDEPLTREMNTP